MKRIKLGQVTAPVGIKGELRVYPNTDITRFSAVKEILVDGETSARSLERVRRDKNLFVIKLSGIEDRNAAETYRNRALYLPEGAPWEMEKDTYFIEDLEGIRVTDEKGTDLGILKSVIKKPGQDLYEIEKPQGGVFLLPAVKEFIVSLDTGERLMKVHLIEGITDL